MPIYFGTHKVTLPGISEAYFGDKKVYSSFVGEPLCFTANTAGSTVAYSVTGTVTTSGIQCSLDGEVWDDWDGTAISLSLVGDTLYVKNNNSTLSSGWSNRLTFTMTGSIAASGNVNSMINYGNLTSSCFCGLFRNCTALTTPPELPATTLADSCYWSMFSGCTSLTTAPELPATTLESNCYYNMFSNCSALITAPELRATTLASSCYSQMFADCTSLTTAPELPATTLARSCYWSMFYYCTSLTIPPELPATTLADSCYYQMFVGCSSLKISNVSGTTLFTCPSLEGLSNPVTNMFSGTSGSYTSDPTAGNTYYFKSPYLTLIANTAGSTVKYTTSGTVTTSGIQYSTNGTDWVNWANNTIVSLQNTGSKIYIKNSNSTLSTGSSNYLKFVMTGSISASGDISSMINYSTLSGYCFESMFRGCASLTSAPELPATILARFCYENMFRECTSLISAPELPATTIAGRCYEWMFRGCTSLVNIPSILPAMTLYDECYYGMFQGCTSITSAPELPSAALIVNCYGYMFYGCTSLTSAPELPATTMAQGCYSDMFGGCTSLITPPELPGTTLAAYCYRRMFQNCTALKISDSSGTLFLTCPSTSGWSSCVLNMFSGTGGTYTSDPTTGGTYYYYT